MNQQLHLTDYLRVLYKRRWVAGLMFLVVFVYGAVNSLKKTSIYEATTQIQIDVEARRANTLNSVLQDPGNWYDDDFYQTQYRILRSRALAWRAITALGIDEPPPDDLAPVSTASRGGVIEWLARMVGAPERIDPPAGDETMWQSQQIDAFLGGLVIAPVRNSRLVDIRYRSADPLFAMQAANAVAEQYIQQGLMYRSQASEDTNRYLEASLEEQRKKVQSSQEALQRFREQYGAVAVTDGQNTPLMQKYSDLNAQLTRARIDLTDQQAIYRSLMAIRDDEDALAAHPEVIGNLEIQAVKAQIADLKSRDAQLEAQGLGPAFPDRVTLAAELGTKNQELDALIDRVIQSVETRFKVAQAREADLATQVEQQKQENLAFDRQAMRYTALEQEARSNRTMYETLLQRAQETGVTGAFGISNVQVVDLAETPRYPILPNTRRDLTLAFLAGCLLAIGLVFGLEYLDNRIKTPDEIKTYLDLPFLGLVPAVSTKENGDKSPLLEDGAPPAFAEAMRSIRTAVVFSSAAEGARTIVVTSTAPHEGKTLVSSNLANALAQTEQRTLVLDGDMRRPRIHDVFGCAQEPGLSNVLVGTAQLRTALRQTSNPNLYVLPAGHIPPNPAELLGSPKYRRLLEELGQEFDWIVTDAPPVMAVTDAAVVANGASGVVFVIGAEMTPRKSAQTAIEQLTSARAKIIGAVLNRVNVERHSYYYAPYHRKDYTRAYVRTQ